MKLLFICSGNTCRSPLAAGMCKGMYKDKVETRSAGMWVYSADPPSEHGRTILMTRYGIDNSSHLSHNVTEEEMAWCDRVYVMTYTQYEVLKKRFEKYADKVFMLDGRIDISDPYAGTMDTYLECERHIRACLINELGEPR